MAVKKLQPIVAQGRNCWRIARATEASVIVDAADYYRHIRAAMLAAQKRIFIVGWDFDTRIALEPDEHGQGETLGRFLLNLARDKPDREIDILKWNFGALKQFVRPQAVLWLARWWRTKAIDFRFDSSHPPGCSHHQKIVVIDESLAACGGIDISSHRWDTSDHIDDDPRRTGPDGKPYMPWHDATMMMRGDVAAQLAELGRERWSTATKAKLGPIEKCQDDWPDDLPVMFRDVDIAISRTRAAYDDLPEVREIETLYIDMICAAKKFIYFENQYFTSAKIGAAIAERMAEPDPPEIVMVMPRSADGWLEQKAMDGARLKLMRAIGDKDKANRFRIYVPVTKKRSDIYVHAKVSILDDRLLRVGSSNLNNRSQGLDSECDVIIDAALDANKDTPAAMTALRHRLLAEHLDCTPEEFTAAEQKHGSMVDAIEAWRGPGKSLELLEMEQLGDAEEFIASNELLDPESPDAMLDPIHKRGLGNSWAKGQGGNQAETGAAVIDPETVPDSERRGLIGVLPASICPFASLMRIDRPIGTWLLFWPCAWGVALAGGRSLLLFAVLAIGAFVMRSAGCVYNDIVDRDLDREVKRTRLRPLASGRISLRAAWALTVGLCLTGLLVLLALTPVAQIVALASLALVAAYPFMKRITWWPQAWLGLVFSWGVLVGWPAVTGSLEGAAILLWLGSIAWVIGYDTLYAIQDIEDDALVGVKSSARRMGASVRLGVGLFYALALLGWGAAIWLVRPDPLALTALIPAAIHLASQAWRADPADGEGALALFRSNRTCGLLVFAAMLVVGLSQSLTA